MNVIRFLKGWRTRLFAIAVAALGVLDMLDPNLIADAIGGENRPLVMLAISVAIIVLRQITTTPPGRSS